MWKALQAQADVLSRLASAEFSPQSCARIGGILYLLIIAAGLFAQAFVRDRLVVPGDAAVTAERSRR